MSERGEVELRDGSVSPSLSASPIGDDVADSDVRSLHRKFSQANVESPSIYRHRRSASSTRLSEALQATVLKIKDERATPSPTFQDAIASGSEKRIGSEDDVTSELLAQPTVLTKWKTSVASLQNCRNGGVTLDMRDPLSVGQLMVKGSEGESVFDVDRSRVETKLKLDLEMKRKEGEMKELERDIEDLRERVRRKEEEIRSLHMEKEKMEAKLKEEEELLKLTDGKLVEREKMLRERLGNLRERELQISNEEALLKEKECYLLEGENRNKSLEEKYRQSRREMEEKRVKLEVANDEMRGKEVKLGEEEVELAVREEKIKMMERRLLESERDAKLREARLKEREREAQTRLEKFREREELLKSKVNHIESGQSKLLRGEEEIENVHDRLKTDQFTPKAPKAAGSDLLAPLTPQFYPTIYGRIDVFPPENNHSIPSSPPFSVSPSPYGNSGTKGRKKANTTAKVGFDNVIDTLHNLLQRDALEKEKLKLMRRLPNRRDYGVVRTVSWIMFISALWIGILFSSFYIFSLQHSGLL